jgi:hypothetical protein
MVEPIPGLSPELQETGVGRAPNEVALKQSSPCATKKEDIIMESVSIKYFILILL